MSGGPSRCEDPFACDRTCSVRAQRPSGAGPHKYRPCDRVIIEQSLTNRSNRPVSFRGSIIAPGRPRLSRQFINYQPGQSGHKHFVLNNAAELAGQTVRVALKELDGNRMWNQLVKIP